MGITRITRITLFETNGISRFLSVFSGKKKQKSLLRSNNDFFIIAIEYSEMDLDYAFGSSSFSLSALRFSAKSSIFSATTSETARTVSTTSSRVSPSVVPIASIILSW